ncbi:Thionin [Thalictrum thalictroides]|uniref:Thionin n=1 Tax=Thalictrum thalictroides TaxID=46969 RepID=A0A7J6XDM6_THATH|nr:Thionin [Thalictrum thalictroides]
MEGKGVRAPFTAVIMGVLILGLIVAQIEAKSCCRNTLARNCYNACRLPGTPRPTCATLCDCIHITGNTCPGTHPKSNMLERAPPLKGCCKDTLGRNCFDSCVESSKDHRGCASLCDCVAIYSPLTCPPTHPASCNMLENSGAMIHEFCKLGCASTVCDAITTTNKNSDVGEGEVNEAVEHCVNACSKLCNKGAKTALASA